MIKYSQYIKLLEVLDRILRHPLLLSVTLESVILYAIDFIAIFGLPEMYEVKEAVIPITNYRGQLPCDLVSINQIKDTCSGKCLRSMTDTFFPSKEKDTSEMNRNAKYYSEFAFKVQNHIVFTSFEEGEILVNYNAIPVDDEGVPMLLDNPLYLKTLELYVKKELFGIKFDLGELNYKVLERAELQYAWSAGQLTSEFNIPDTSEMESISRMFTEMILTTTHFDNGFKHLGDREYIRRH